MAHNYYYYYYKITIMLLADVGNIAPVLVYFIAPLVADNVFVCVALLSGTFSLVTCRPATALAMVDSTFL